MSGTRVMSSPQLSEAKHYEVTHFNSAGTRALQEDYGIADLERGLFAVADGFGGPGAGPEAAKLACESIQHFLRKGVGDDDATLPFVLKPYYTLAGNVLFNAIVHANRKLNRLNRGRSVLQMGGASIVAAFEDRGMIAIGVLGSCRAALIRGAVTIPLVQPRSLRRFRDPGLGQSSHLLDIPIGALGLYEEVEPEVFEFRMEKGDQLILHTDGITPAQADELATHSGADPESLGLRGHMGDNYWITLINGFNR